MATTINTNTTLSQITIAEQKATIVASYQAVITGLNDGPSDLTSFIIGNKTYVKSDLIKLFQTRIDAAKKVMAARTALHLAVVAERQVTAEVAPIRSGLKTVLQGRFGKSGAELQQYGFTPQKKAQRTAATKAGAALQGKSTRAARGTKGKKQKALIKGARPAPIALTAPAASSLDATTTAHAPAPAPAAAKPAPSTPGATQ
jgi:hypothetical protein